MKRFVLLSGLILLSTTLHCQVLISILLGDKVNSPNLEFGLDGGFNFSDIVETDPSKTVSNFHLGFYFDLRMKNNLWLRTGVRVKSSVGAQGIAVYSIGDSDVDSVFAGGSIERKLNYFYVPVLAKFRFKNNFFVEGGITTGLLHGATDIFLQSTFENDDTKLRRDIRNELNRIDFGLSAGVGYKIMKNTGMSVGVNYYRGIVDIYKDNRTGYNSSWFLYVFVPIGRGKAEEKRQQKVQEN